jgi:uncharacterized protein
MPSYSPPTLLFNKHLETIYPSLIRRVELPAYKRERIPTPDADFLDLDWLEKGSKNLVIISHGLEGNSERAYVMGMAKAFFNHDFDVLAWNYRGCSGEVNKQLRFYHSGATDDLSVVVDHASAKYDCIFLIGFSLGGNLTLKYLGEQKKSIAKLKKAVVFSVPLHLHSSCLQILTSSNWLYHQRFLRSLKNKVIEKSKLQPSIAVEKLSLATNLIAFDDYFTAPIHGFKNAVDYYTQNSAIHFLDSIQVPTLIVNALNDPFLSNECFPSVANAFIQFETPERGGHVGFTQFNQNGLYWSEFRALAFIQHD